MVLPTKTKGKGSKLKTTTKFLIVVGTMCILCFGTVIILQNEAILSSNLNGSDEASSIIDLNSLDIKKAEGTSATTATTGTAATKSSGTMWHMDLQSILDDWLGDGYYNMSTTEQRMQAKVNVSETTISDSATTTNDSDTNNSDTNDSDTTTNDNNNTTTNNNEAMIIQEWNVSTYSTILQQQQLLLKQQQHQHQQQQQNSIDQDLTMTVMLPNNITGTIQQDGQLVVNLINRTDHMLWKQGQTNLCSLLKSMALLDTIPYPDTAKATASSLLPKRPLLNMTLDCYGMKHAPGRHMGEGNMVIAVYTTRLTTAAARVDFQFQCYDGNQSQMELLLPWVAVPYQKAPDDSNPWPYKGGRLPTYTEACSNLYQHTRLDFMIDEIQSDMRKMGVTLLGSRVDGGGGEGSIQKQHPLVPVDCRQH
jgi:hypothetical protein